ncbi:hypothetical protein T492DRAFT_1107470 [Pavlovales sp. CCMP2436]|nr:hypothetical protein T492DRAFT_1107470 [Pavlovales sp. CCMP2436]|mmetsp:Transcript_15238/g.35428  ORF Transcript_15238/g.35428 Transcript_15238/m.35428 type:complete len:245 (+) Transcript_15238:442-1176(+)
MAGTSWSQDEREAPDLTRRPTSELLPKVLLVVAGGDAADQVAGLLDGSFGSPCSGRASITVDIARLDEAHANIVAVVVLVVEVDGDGLSAATKKWMRTGRAELLSARRCEIVTVANSACRNSATALKPCALGATAKLGVRLRAGGAAVHEAALYLDVGVAIDVEDTIDAYVRALALGRPPPPVEAVASTPAEAAASTPPEAAAVKHVRRPPRAARVLGRAGLAACVALLGIGAVVVRRLLTRRA